MNRRDGIGNDRIFKVDIYINIFIKQCISAIPQYYNCNIEPFSIPLYCDVSVIPAGFSTYNYIHTTTNCAYVALDLNSGRWRCRDIKILSRALDLNISCRR